MSKARHRGVVAVGSAMALLVGAISSALGCGLDWRVPHVGPFADGYFDEKGHVLYAEEIGRLKLGEGESYEEIPLYIKFSSKYQSASPYLGYGWMLPLLESRIVQLNEREFLAEMPNGWTRIFYREDENATMLQEGGGWKGEIKDDLISVYAECGWKLVFKKGQLVSITTPKNHRLDYQFKDGVVREVKEGNQTVLDIERDRVNNEVAGLSYGKNQHIGIEFGDKPQVQYHDGQNVIGEITKTLSKVTSSDGEISNFEFTVNEQNEPILEVRMPDGKSQKIGWSAQTKQLISTNDWTYAISFPEHNRSLKVQRTNLLGQSELWSRDSAAGIIERETTDRNYLKYIFFASGPAKGLRRKVVSRDENGEFRTIWSAAYDENGSLKRVVDGDILRSYDKGWITSISSKGLKLYEVSYIEKPNNIQ